MSNPKSIKTVLTCAVVVLGCVTGAPTRASASRRARVPSIKSVSLLRSSTLGKIKSLSPGTSDSSLALSNSLLKGLTLRANPSSHPAGTAIRFKLQRDGGKTYLATKTKYPYLFKSGTGAGKWKLTSGKYNLAVTTYRTFNGRTYRGPSTQLSFILDSSAAPSDPVIKPSIPNIPNLSKWASNMTSYGRRHCEQLKSSSVSFDSHLAATYYDAEWVFYQIGDYTGDSYWYDCAQLAERVYRDSYVVANGGKVPGYWNFTHGLTEDFLRTGDANSKNAVHLLATTAAFAPDSTPLNTTVSADLSREVAYAIMAYLNDERVGNPHRARTEALVSQALGHMDQWFVSHSAAYVRPFMFALTAHALISYQTQIGGNSAIVPALIKGADWIWDNTWLPSQRAFQYTDHAVASGGTEAAPDLNQLIAPVYAWLWQETGQTRFRDRADQIFAGGADGAFLSNGKQFNQSYRLSFKFMEWRSATPD